MCIRDSYDGTQIQMKYYLPVRAAEKKRPALIFIHGGGYKTVSYTHLYAAPAAMPAAPSFSQGSADDFAVVDDNEDLPF